MSGSQSTGAMLGVGAAVIDLLNWWFTGHPFPIPDDAKASMVVVGGYASHALSEVTTLATTMITDRYFPPKKDVVTPQNTNTGVVQ